MAGAAGVAGAAAAAARTGIRPPRPLGLGEAVGDDPQGLELVAVAEVGGGDLDVLGAGRGLGQAALPRDDAVVPRVDARRGHLERGGAHREGLLGEHPGEVAAVHEAVHRPGAGGCRMAAERAAEGDDRACVVGQGAGHLAGVDAAGAPADEADAAAVAVVDLEQEVLEALGELGAGAEVAALAPVVGTVAEAAQVTAEEDGRLGAGEEAGEHDDGVAVALRPLLEVAGADGRVGELERHPPLAAGLPGGGRVGSLGVGEAGQLGHGERVGWSLHGDAPHCPGAAAVLPGSRRCEGGRTAV